MYELVVTGEGEENNMPTWVPKSWIAGNTEDNTNPWFAQKLVVESSFKIAFHLG